MRTVFILVAVAGLGWLFLVQKHREPPPAAPTLTAVKQPATPRPVSEHNWMKRSLDRTSEVKRQVAEQRQQDGNK